MAATNEALSVRVLRAAGVDAKAEAVDNDALPRTADELVAWLDIEVPCSERDGGEEDGSPATGSVLEGVRAVLERRRQLREACATEAQETATLLPEQVRTLVAELTTTHRETASQVADGVQASLDVADDAIVNISDAMQHVVRRAEELRRLEAARQYLTTLHRAMVVSERAKAAIMGDAPMSGFADFVLLCSVCDAAAALDSPGEALAMTRRRVEELGGELRTHLSAQLQTALKAIRWPLSKQRGGGLDLGEGRLDRVRDLFQHLVRVQTLIRRTDDGQPLQAIQLLALPIAKRFAHHFGGARSTNRRDKPEWFFSFVLDAIGDHAEFVVEHLQPLMRSAGANVDALTQFIHCLVSTTTSKVSSLLAAVDSDRDLVVHLLDELLLFEQALDGEYGYGFQQHLALGNTSAATPASSFVCGRVLHVFTQDDMRLQLWLDTDSHFALHKLQAAMDSPSALESPYADVDAMVTSPKGHGAGQAASDMESSNPATLPTESAEAAFRLVKAVADRYRLVVDTRVQLAFVDGIQRLLLQRYREWLQAQARACSVADASPTDDAWRRYLQVVNSLHFVATVLVDWAEEPFLVKLFDAATTQRPDGEAPFSSLLAAVVGAGGDAGDAAAPKAEGEISGQAGEGEGPAESGIDGEDERKEASTRGAGLIGPTHALRALSSAIVHSSITRSALSSVFGGSKAAASEATAVDGGDKEAEKDDKVGASEEKSEGDSARGGQEAAAAHSETQTPTVDAQDVQRWSVDGGLFGPEVDALRTAAEQLLTVAADAILYRFREATVPYFAKTQLWSGPVAAALRRAGDLSPDICEGLAVLRVALVESSGVLCGPMFRTLCRLVAAGVQKQLVRGVESLTYVSEAGAQQLHFDACAVEQLFQLYASSSSSGNTGTPAGTGDLSGLATPAAPASAPPVKLRHLPFLLGMLQLLSAPLAKVQSLEAGLAVLLPPAPGAGPSHSMAMRALFRSNRDSRADVREEASGDTASVQQAAQMALATCGVPVDPYQALRTCRRRVDVQVTSMR